MLTIEDDIGARRRSRGRSTTAPKYEGQSIARTWVGRLGLTSQSALVRGRLAAPLSTDDDNRRRHLSVVTKSEGHSIAGTEGRR